MLRNYLKRFKTVKLGRWDIKKSNTEKMKLVDFANCDSCGTCNLPKYIFEKKPKNGSLGMRE